ncbi:MAG: hypothetical protein MUO21_03450 [Nitrososphaeraceae archaeon]|nr:hypothetical protein [Nitrososphaeraceae archaeon]
MAESESINAIELTRRVFEHVHGNLGVLRFNIEELTPTNGNTNEASKKWKIICSFFETLGSASPSRFEVNVDLNGNTVRFKKISGPSGSPDKASGSYIIKKKTK